MAKARDQPPFKLGKPFVRQPRGDTRGTPEDKQRLADERAAEIARRRAESTPPSTEEINLPQQHHELFPTHTGVMHEALLHKTALVGFTTHAYPFKRFALRLQLPIPPPSHLT